MLVIFSASFIFFAVPVDAAKSCNDDPVAGIKKVKDARGPGQFLVAGCGSVLDIASGLEISCYHSLSGVVQVVLKAGEIILGIIGSLALLMFVWGGFQWLIAAGSEKRITGGMTTLKNAVISLLIVFGAWIAANLIVATLNPSESGGVKLAFQSASEQWWQVHKGATCLRPLSSKELADALAAPALVKTPPTDWAVRGACCWSESPIPTATTPIPTADETYPFSTTAIENLDKATCQSKGNTIGYFMQEKWFCKDKKESACGARTPDQGWDGVDTTACEKMWDKEKIIKRVGPKPAPPVLEPAPGTVAPGLPPGSPNVETQPEIPAQP